MHICTVATLCFPEKTVPRNYYYCVQDDNSLCLCFKNMYRTLFVAIFTSTFIFSMSKSSHTYRNINISNLPHVRPHMYLKTWCVYAREALVTFVCLLTSMCHLVFLQLMYVLVCKSYHIGQTLSNT